MNCPSIRIEDAILSPDILERLEDAPGQHPTDFGLDSGTKVKDEIACAWAKAQDYCPIYRAALACQTDVLLTGDIRDFEFLMNARKKAGGLLVQTVADFLKAPGHPLRT
jgi:hypothetical protein